MIIAPHADPVAHNLSKAKMATFNVAKNPQKLIQVVVRSLYSNPTLATLVELGQNCHDEHLRCGKSDVPFEVTLPTVFEPTLKVRDFGRGIPHEYMMRGYTHIFESTKDNDSDMSGGYGVGRCVVLSLSSTYTIVTFIQGKKRTYSIFESEKGIELVHLSTEDTNERDGTLVTAPVSQNDVSAFRDAVMRAYRYYKTQPIIKGAGADFKLDKPDYVIQGTNWAIENDTTTPKAICGIYQYDITPENMGRLSDAHNNLLHGGGLVLRFGPSDLDVQANRQGLHYNDRTRTAIVNALKVVEKEASTIINKEFDACPSYYAAKVKWAEFYASNAMRKISNIAKSIGNITWRNVPIGSDRVEMKDIQGITATGYYWAYNHRGGGYKVMHEAGFSYFECSPKYHIFINDMPGGRGAIQRVKAFLRSLGDNNGHKAITICFHNNPQVEAAFFKQTNLQKSDFQLVSSLPKPTATRGESNPSYSRARTKFFVYDGEGITWSSSNSDAWDIDEDMDLTESGGLYVEIERFKPYFRGAHKSVRDFGHTIENIRKIGGLANDETIIGIRTTASEELAIVRNSPNWKSLEDYVSELVKSYVIPDEELQVLVDVDYRENLPYEIRRICGYDSSYKPKQSDYRALVEAMKALDKAVDSKKKEQIKEKHASFRWLGGVIKDDDIKPTYDINALFENIKKRFPVIKIFESYAMANHPAIVDALFLKLEKLEAIEKAEEAEKVA